MNDFNETFYAQELIDMANKVADAWNDQGSSSFAQEHGLTFAYHSDAESIREITEKFSVHGDMQKFNDDIMNLDTILRDELWEVLDAIEEQLEEEDDYDGQPSWEQEWADFGEEY